MQSESFKIILPLPSKWLQPNRITYSVQGAILKNNTSQKQKRLTSEAIGNEQIETLPWNNVRVSTVFYYGCNRRRDTDNAIASLKSMYDGIVNAGVVPDDNPEFMQRLEPQFKIDKQNPRLEVFLERIR